MSPANQPAPITSRDPVGQLVTGDPVTIAEKLTLRSVAAVLDGADIGAALVERDDGTIGIVSERDVTRALAEEADPDVIWSADVMTEDLVTAGADETILEAARKMIDARVRHLGITRDGEIVGVISARDVLAVLVEDALGVA